MEKMAKDRLPDLSRVGQTKNKQVLSFYHDCMLRVFDNHASRPSDYLEKVIFTAARTGDSQKLYNALQRIDFNKVNINSKENDNENSPLIVAAECGHEEVVSILLSCGSDVTLRNASGRTALDIAPKKIKGLILDAVNRQGAGHTLLWQAAWQGNATVVKKLLNLNPKLNVNSKNSEGCTPLLLVTRDLNLFDKIKQEVFSENYNPTEVVAQLLHQDADCTVVDFEGRSALHLTARHRGTNAKDIINLLARKDSLDVDLRDEQYRSPLHFASETGDPNIMLALIDNGADINARGHLGKTPLHITASRGDEDASCLLVHHGANVLLIDDLGFTPVDVAKGDNVLILLKEAWSEHVDRSMNSLRIKSAPNTLPSVKLEHLEIQDVMNDDEEQKLQKKTSRKSLKKLRGRSNSEEQKTAPPISNLPKKHVQSSGPTSRYSLDVVQDINQLQSGRRLLGPSTSSPGFVKDFPPDSGTRQTRTPSRLPPSEVPPRTAAKVTVLNIDCKLPKQKSKSCSELPFSRYRVQKLSSQRTTSESIEHPFDDALRLRGRSLSGVVLSSFDTLPGITPEVPDKTETAALPETQIVITPLADDQPVQMMADNSTEADGDVLNRTFNSNEKPIFWFPLVKDEIETDQSSNHAFFVNLDNLESPVSKCAKCGRSLISSKSKPSHGTSCFSCHQDSVAKNCFWVSLDGKATDEDLEMAERFSGFNDRTVSIDKKMLSGLQGEKSNESTDIEEDGMKYLKEEGELSGRKEKLIRSKSDMTKVDRNCREKIDRVVIRTDAEGDTLKAENDVRHEDFGGSVDEQLKKYELNENKAHENKLDSCASFDHNGQQGCQNRNFEEPKESEEFKQRKLKELKEQLVYEQRKECEASKKEEDEGCEESKEQQEHEKSKEHRGMMEQQGLMKLNAQLEFEELTEKREYNELKEKQGDKELEEQLGYNKPIIRRGYKEAEEPGDRLGTIMDQEDQAQSSTSFGTESHDNTLARRDSDSTPHEVVIVNPFPSPVPPKVPVVNVRSNCHCDRLATLAKQPGTGGKRKGKGKGKKPGTSTQTSVAKTKKGSSKTEGDSRNEEKPSKKKSAVTKRKKKDKETRCETLKEISVSQPNLKADNEAELKSAGNREDNPSESHRVPGTEEADGDSLPLHDTASMKGMFTVLTPIPESSLSDSAVVEATPPTKTEVTHEEEPTNRDNRSAPKLTLLHQAVGSTCEKLAANTIGDDPNIAATQGGVGEVREPGIAETREGTMSEVFGTVSETDKELEDMIQEILEETEELEKKHAKLHGSNVDSTKTCTTVHSRTDEKSNVGVSDSLEHRTDASFSTHASCSTHTRSLNVTTNSICNAMTGTETSTRDALRTCTSQHATHAIVNTSTRSQTNVSARDGVNTDSTDREKGHQPNQPNQPRSGNVFDNVSSWLLGIRGFPAEQHRESPANTGATDSTYGSRSTTPKARMADISSDYSSLSDDTWDLTSGRVEHVIDKGQVASQETSASDTSIPRLPSERWSTSSARVSVAGDSSGNDRASVGDTRTSEEMLGSQFVASGGLVHSRLGRRKLEHSMTLSSDTTSSEEEEIVWKKGNVLGKGAFGTVWCGLTNTGQMIAVKQVELITSNMEVAERQYEKLQEEVALLKSLRHENVVSYLGTCLDGGVVNIFMQFVPGGSIASILARFGPLEETVFRYYTRQIVVGVEYLHRKNVVHRDIKGGNIMLMPTGVIKLIDFGCAKRLYMNMSQSQEDLLHSMKGTPYWMAPEVITETGYGRKSDIWSIGCTVYEMATGKPPWSHLPPMSAILAIGQGTDPPTLAEPNSLDACNFVTCSMTRNQNIRWSAEELLHHPFLKNCDQHR